MTHLLVLAVLWAYVEWVSRASATPEARHANLIRWHRIVFGVLFVWALARLGIRAAFTADLVGDDWIPAARRGVGVAGGVLLALWGNYVPKLLSPWSRDEEPFDWQRVHRFAGWLATIGGLSVAAIWLTLPPDSAAAVARGVLIAVFALAIGRKVISLATHPRVVALVIASAAAASPAAGQSPRPQDPVPPFPYAQQEVSFTNVADSTRLAGTLTVPAGDGPFPAVLLLSGAGPQDRDYHVLGHRFFLVLADHLARAGIAVLRVDDRGAGASGGDSAAMTLPDAVGDVQAAVALLAAHPRTDAARIGLVAHSEGGRVAPVALTQSDAVAFLVLLAPPAVSAEDLIAGQAASAGGDPVALAQAALTVMLRRRVQDEPNPQAALAAVWNGFDAWVASLPADQARVMQVLSTREPFRPQVAQLVAAFATPWNRSLFALDPAPPLRAIAVPVLALYGDRDRQAPPAQNVPVLDAHWSGRPDATVRVLPGLNHFFQHAETGLPTEIPQIEETLAPDALDAVADWIVERFTEAAGR